MIVPRFKKYCKYVKEIGQDDKFFNLRKYL